MLATGDQVNARRGYNLGGSGSLASRLNRVININEPVIQIELVSKIAAQRLHAVSFRRVMTGREKMYTALPCYMHSRFRYFSRNVGIYSG